MPDSQNFNRAEEAISSDEMARLVEFLNAQRFADAESQARAQLSRHPKCAFTWKALGIALWMQGKDPRSALTQATELTPEDAEAHSNLGHALLEFGQPLEAVQSCRRAITLDPRLAEAHGNLGNALLRLGRLDDAIDSYQAALQLRPHVATIHNNLGEALHAAGLLDDALASYGNALTCQADFAEAYNNLGNTQRALRRIDEAERSYREALRVRPRFAAAHGNLGTVLLALGRPHEAVASYRKALECSPGHCETHSNLGNALLCIDQIEEAEKSCQRALEINPRFAEALNNLANARRRLGRVEQATENYRQAIALKPDYAEAFNNLGNALLTMWRLEEALGVFREALRIKPDYAQAHLNLAIALLHVWQMQEAIDSCQRALEIEPDLAEAHNLLGNALFEANKVHEAEATFRRAIALKPLYAEAHCTLGFVMRRLHRPEEAKACAERALEIDAQLPEAHLLLAELSADEGAFAKAEELIHRASARDPRAASVLATLPAMRRMTSADAAWAANAQLLLERPLAPRHEAGLSHSLGKYFDDMGDFDQAFAHYRRSKEVCKRFRPRYDPAAQTRTIDAIIERYTAEWVNRARNLNSPPSRAVFVVGTPRSGTTLVEQILASHPNVFGAGEQHFWNAAANRASGGGAPSDAALDAMARDNSKMLATLSPEASRVVDKLSVNFMHLGLIHAALPEARIIHMRRDPIASCLSIYMHPFSVGHTYSNDLQDLAHFYQEYARLMAYWRSILPPRIFLDVPYEALVANPEQWIRRLIEFIGLSWDSRCLNQHLTKRSVIIHNSRWQVRQRISESISERWRNYEKFAGPLNTLQRFRQGEAQA